MLLHSVPDESELILIAAEEWPMPIRMKPYSLDFRYSLEGGGGNFKE